MPADAPLPARSASRPLRRYGWALAAVLVVLGATAWLHHDLPSVALAALKAGRDTLVALFHGHPATTVAAYFALYALVALLWIPGSVVLTIAAGAIFGFPAGLAAASFASSLGATLAFLSSRYLLRDIVQARFAARLAPINEGMRRDGALYLFSLRLMPVFPFFLVNLLVGLTPIGAWRFYWVTQLGTLALTAIYVNAGTQLAAIERLSDVLSPTLLGSLALLAVFPLVARLVVRGLRRRRG